MKENSPVKILTVALVSLCVTAIYGCEKIGDQTNGDADAIEEAENSQEEGLEEEAEITEEETAAESDESGETNYEETLEEGEIFDDEAEAETEGENETSASKCKLPPLLDTIFDIDADGPQTQIHPEVIIYDGAIWVAYNRPDKNKKFDVYFTALECDGTPRIKPYLVNTSDFNDIDPTIAASGDVVLVAWSSDNSVAPRNLDIHFRLFTKEGIPLSGEDARYSAKGAQDKDDFNAWMVKAAPMSDGSFAIVGDFAPDDAKQWQTFAQIIGADGTLSEPLIRPYADALNGQFNPSAVQAEDGRLYIAWGETGDDDSYSAVVAAFDPKNFTPPVSKRYVAIEKPAGQYVCLSADLGSGTVYLSGDSGTLPKPVLTDVTTLGEPGFGYISATAGGGKAEYSAVVQATQDGAAIGWFRNISGIRNDFFAQRFSYASGSFAKKGDAYQINVNAVAPYQPSLTYLGGGLFLAVWSEGTSPNLRLKGKIFAL